MSIAAYDLRYPISVNAQTSDVVGMPESLWLVCLWTGAGLVLTAFVFALGLGGEAGQFLAVAG